MKKLLSFIWFFVFAMLLFSVTAFAYIDPSAMTYIIQIIAGAAIAAGAAFGYYFRKIKRVFSKHKKNGAADIRDYDDTDDDDTGLGDYDLPETQPAASQVQSTPQPVSAPKAQTIAIPTFEDKYDETGGEAGLAAENRELRRLLAQEREKVAILTKALNICTGQGA